MTETTNRALEVGYEKQVSYLNEIEKSGKIHHAYLFIGVPEGAHNALAEYWAKRLVGHTGPSAAHQDILIMRYDDADYITVKEAREVRRHLSTTPAVAKRRVVVLEQAERCTRQAANALLKVLEEPQAETVTILATSTPDQLPDTLRSRLHTVYVPPLIGAQARQVASVLDQALTAGELEEAVHMSSGRFQRLHDLVSVGVSGSGFASRAEFWISFLEGSVTARDAAVKKQFGLSVKDNEELHQLSKYLDTAQEVIHDIFLLATRSDQALVFIKQRDRLEGIASQWGKRQSAIRLALIDRIRLMEIRKVNKKNILDYLTIRL